MSASHASPPEFPRGEPLTELPVLTGLRGFAALWVLLYHVWGASAAPLRFPPGADLEHSVGMNWPFTFGWAGVDLFFCLSAFLLALPYAEWRYGQRAKPDTGRYLLRRVLRIYPAYLAQLALVVIAAYAFDVGAKPSGRELIAHLFLWFNMGEHWVAPLVSPWFTLPIEFSFYLLLPFLAYLLDRRRWPWLLVGAVVVSIAYRMIAFAHVAGEPVPVRVVEIERMPGRIDQFVIGMLAGAAFVAARLRGWRPPALDALFWFGVFGFAATCAGLLLALNTYWDGNPLLYVWHGIASAFLVCVLLAGAWEAKPARALFGNRALRYLGATSFGVYLWHMPVLVGIARFVPETWSPPLRLWVLIALVLPATLVVAHVSYVLIERPALRIGRPRSAHPGLETPLADRN